MNLRDEALRYAAAGIPVFPLHWIKNDGTCSCRQGDLCECKGKHPRIKNWGEEASTDPEKVGTWWDRAPLANIGIPMGERTGLVALDVDTRHGGDASLEQLEQEFGKLPTTITATTGGGGKHYIFKYTEELCLKNVVGFTNTFTEQERDKNFSAKIMANELPGILAWAVKGCLIWQQDGLRTPDEVTRATAEYRTEMDAFNLFFEECCVEDPEGRISNKMLRAKYDEWCKENGEYLLTMLMHSQCQKVVTKSTHFSWPSALGGLLNSSLTPGNTLSVSEMRLLCSATQDFM